MIEKAFVSKMSSPKMGSKDGSKKEGFVAFMLDTHLAL